MAPLDQHRYQRRGAQIGMKPGLGIEDPFEFTSSRNRDALLGRRHEVSVTLQLFLVSHFPVPLATPPPPQQPRPLDQPSNAPHRRGHHHPRRRRTPPQTDQPNQKDPVALVDRPRTTRPRPLCPRLPAPLRHRALLPVREEHSGLGHPLDLHPRTSRPVDLDHRSRLHPTPARPTPHRRPQTPLGTTPQTPPALTRTHPQRVPGTYRNDRHPSQTTKTLPSRTRPTQRLPIRPQTTPPSHQKDSLN